MAAFLFDSFSQLPNTPFIMVSGFLEDLDTTNTPNFPQFYQPESFHQIPSTHETSCLGNGTVINNGTSVTNKQSPVSSSVVDKPEIGVQANQNLTSMDKKKKKNGDGFCQSKGKKQKKCNGGKKDDVEKKGKDEKKVGDEEPSTGYIHVRARRGQATDSHSLAERVRREKISERMKLLQALVPGCDKVSGKALMLDEIINYVQSLQNQVEFLSMKLASANPMFYDFGVDLDSLMVTPEIRVNGLVSPMPDVPNSYPLVDTAAPLVFPYVQWPNILLQDNNGQLLWDVDDQRQKLLSQSGFTKNNLCSFH